VQNGSTFSALLGEEEDTSAITLLGSPSILISTTRASKLQGLGNEPTPRSNRPLIHSKDRRSFNPETTLPAANPVYIPEEAAQAGVHTAAATVPAVDPALPQKGKPKKGYVPPCRICTHTDEDGNRCGKTASFSFPGTSRRTHCAAHKRPGMIQVGALAETLIPNCVCGCAGSHLTASDSERGSCTLGVKPAGRVAGMSGPRKKTPVPTRHPVSIAGESQDGRRALSCSRT
jgi:hypothetical protein